MDNPLLQPDPGLFIWTILTFLVLLALLAKFAWGPLLEALESRQQSIREVARRCPAGEAGTRAARAGVRADHAAGARRGRGDHHRQPRRRRAAARGDAAEGARRGGRHRPRTPSGRFSSKRRGRCSRSAARRSICRCRSRRRCSSATCRKEDNERLIQETLKQVQKH